MRACIRLCCLSRQPAPSRRQLANQPQAARSCCSRPPSHCCSRCSLHGCRPQVRPGVPGPGLDRVARRRPPARQVTHHRLRNCWACRLEPPPALLCKKRCPCLPACPAHLPACPAHLPARPACLPTHLARPPRPPAEALIFWENYLGTLERSITLNFSKPATNIIAQ